MERERLVKPDGRYLLLYTFAAAAPPRPLRRPAQGAAGQARAHRRKGGRG